MKTERSKQVVEMKEPLHVALTDYFLKSGGKVLTYKAISEEMKAIKKSREDVSFGSLYDAICKVRERLEVAHGLTLWNEKGVGYKLASPKQTALFGLRLVKRMVVLAGRTERIVPIIDRKYVPEAFEEVFGKAEGQLKQLHTNGKRFLKVWADNRKLLENTNGHEKGAK